ncbi:MAG: hypothetical protein AB7W59_02220 [Acidimicrobiia bacterium]
MSIAVDDSGGVARTMSNSVTTAEWDTPREELVVTGVDKSATERLLGLADFTVTFEGTLDTTADVGAHFVFRTVPSTSVARTVTLTIASQVLACETLFTSYALTREDDGGANWSAEGALASGTVPTWA